MFSSVWKSQRLSALSQNYGGIFPPGKKCNFENQGNVSLLLFLSWCGNAESTCSFSLPAWKCFTHIFLLAWTWTWTCYSNNHPPIKLAALLISRPPPSGRHATTTATHLWPPCYYHGHPPLAAMLCYYHGHPPLATMLLQRPPLWPPCYYHGHPPLAAMLLPPTTTATPLWAPCYYHGHPPLAATSSPSVATVGFPPSAAGTMPQYYSGPLLNNFILIIFSVVKAPVLNQQIFLLF